MIFRCRMFGKIEPKGKSFNSEHIPSLYQRMRMIKFHISNARMRLAFSMDVDVNIASKFEFNSYLIYVPHTHTHSVSTWIDRMQNVSHVWENKRNYTSLCRVEKIIPENLIREKICEFGWFEKKIPLSNWNCTVGEIQTEAQSANMRYLCKF